MSLRRTILATNEIYHVTNRGVLKREIFKKCNDYQRFIDTISFYMYSHPKLRFSYFQKLNLDFRKEFINEHKTHQKLVEILAFCLMPNHFHLLIKQKAENGISVFMKNFQTSYALYFNTKYEQEGHLFKSIFRSAHISDANLLLHVSRYIHLNPASSYLIKLGDLEKYKWSSFGSYIRGASFDFLSPNHVLENFKNVEKYKEFVYNQADYQKSLQNIKNSSLER